MEITKTDISDGSPLPGAKIEIYDHEKQLIRSGKTDENGLITFENLPVGNYFFKETAAPDGYILDSKLYPFEVKKDGEIVRCSITITPKPTYLLLTKVSASTGKPLESAVFGLYDAKKKLLEKQTSDEDGKVLFENLKPGTYFYRELAAPKGYQKDDAWKKITIKQYGQQVKAEVENQSITPAVQTGDDFPILLLLAVAMLAVVMAVVVFRHSRKKKGEKNKG